MRIVCLCERAGCLSPARQSLFECLYLHTSGFRRFHSPTRRSLHGRSVSELAARGDLCLQPNPLGQTKSSFGHTKVCLAARGQLETGSEAWAKGRAPETCSVYGFCSGPGRDGERERVRREEKEGERGLFAFQSSSCQAKFICLPLSMLSRRNPSLCICAALSSRRAAIENISNLFATRLSLE